MNYVDLSLGLYSGHKLVPACKVDSVPGGADPVKHFVKLAFVWPLGQDGQGFVLVNKPGGR
jgi:hypothetical protein